MIPKQIPLQPFYLDPLFISIFSGIFIFFQIIDIIQIIFDSIWKNKSFESSIFIILLFLILLIISSFEVSLIFIFLQIYKEDYKWWWNSFNGPFFTGIIYIIYSLYYFLKILNNNNFLSLIIYLLINILIGLIISLICGFSGFILTFNFLKKLFNKMFN